MSDPAPATVLIVDDDLGLLRLVERSLKREGFQTASCSSGQEAIAWVAKNKAALMLLDLKLQDIEGKELINHLTEIGRSVPFVIITGQGDERVAVEMMKRGALDYLVKDVNFIEFVPTVVRRAFERLATERHLALSEEERAAAEAGLAEANGQLAEDLVRMERLHEVSIRLAQQDDKQTLLEQILDAAIEITKADAGHVELLDHQSRIGKVAAHRRLPKACVNYLNSDYARHTASSQALKRGDRVSIEDLTKSSIYAGGRALQVFLNAGLRAVQSIPLVSGRGRILGVFSTHYRQPHLPTDRDLLLLDLLARQAADLLERSVAEESLRESEARFRLMADHAPVLIWMSGPDQLCTWFNRPWLEFTGRTLQQELGNGWADGVHPDDLARCLDTYGKAVDARKSFAMEYRLRRHDGEWRWVYDQGIPLREPDGALTGYIGSCIDVTDRKELEKQILETSEREQRKFGHELHDGLGQRLTGLEMLSNVLAEDLKDHAKELAKQARRLNTELRETVTEARLISHGLAPVPLDGDGLMRGLGELAARTGRHKGVKCRFLCEPPVLVEDQTVATHLYRIAQEAVTNALKHGKARKIEIRLTEASDVLKLGIENNGQSLPAADQAKNGVGLNAMRYRAGIIGGTLCIESGRRKGVNVTCTLRRK